MHTLACLEDPPKQSGPLTSRHLNSVSTAAGEKKTATKVACEKETATKAVCEKETATKAACEKKMVTEAARMKKRAPGPSHRTRKAHAQVQYVRLEMPSLRLYALTSRHANQPLSRLPNCRYRTPAWMECLLPRSRPANSDPHPHIHTQPRRYSPSAWKWP